MRKVLMVSPHFPPDTSAGAHRVRLLAPHLPRYGWEPTVVTVDPRGYEGRLDPSLAALVPASVRVVRSRALPAAWTRVVGVGDLGLRSFAGLRRASVEVLKREPFDALFVTIYPTYTALLGPALKRRFDVPFVLDYQDPWVGAWGLSVGAGPNGAPDIKSRWSRRLATFLEPRAVAAADAITAVSSATYEDVWARYPRLKRVPCAAIPLGGEPSDFAAVPEGSTSTRYLDDDFHLSYVGTVLPLGLETLRAVLKAAALLRERRPDLYSRLRLHFFGTSNQTSPSGLERVVPLAREIGVADRVSEEPSRLDYLDALAVLRGSTAILVLGSSERHYTASKIFPALFAKRPVLAVFHEASSVVDILRATAGAPTARLVTYDDHARAESRVQVLSAELEALIESPTYDLEAVNVEALGAVTAERQAAKLAAVLDGVARTSRTA